MEVTWCERHERGIRYVSDFYMYVREVGFGCCKRAVYQDSDCMILLGRGRIEINRLTLMFAASPAQQTYPNSPAWSNVSLRIQSQSTSSLEEGSVEDPDGPS